MVAATREAQRPLVAAMREAQRLLAAAGASLRSSSIRRPVWNPRRMFHFPSLPQPSLSGSHVPLSHNAYLEGFLGVQPRVDGPLVPVGLLTATSTLKLCV